MDLKFLIICVIFKTISSQECVPDFRCLDGSVLGTNNICNGVDDCDDGSDEADCGLPCSRECPEYHSRCGSSCQCVDNLLYLCDGWNHCRNGADENLPECTNCTEDEFKCSNGRCIPFSNVCDGRHQCSNYRWPVVDKSDEEQSLCATPCTHACPTDFFRCGSSCQCVPNTHRCDGDDDCENGADEMLPDCSQVECLVCYSSRITPRGDENFENKDCEIGVEGANVTTKRCYRCLSIFVKYNGFECYDGIKKDFKVEGFQRVCSPIDDRFPLGCIDIQDISENQKINIEKADACSCDTDKCTCECDSSTAVFSGPDMTFYMLIMLCHIQRLIHRCPS